MLRYPELFPNRIKTMKFSNNLIGALIFTILAVAVFVFMAMRPAVEGDAMIFGMPATNGNNTNEPVPAVTETIETKTEEVSDEPVKKEEVDNTASTQEAPLTTPATLEAPATIPAPSEVPVTNPATTEAPATIETPTTENMPASAPATMSEPSSVTIPSSESAAPANQ
jgi:outer membrane biosynthesis protein TonB